MRCNMHTEECKKIGGELQYLDMVSKDVSVSTVQWEKRQYAAFLCNKCDEIVTKRIFND